ncbi:MAG: glycosyltransferase [Planctomycetales bacterium]|nr:glycosyltransferase [Planctomycetales bacterium]
MTWESSFWVGVALGAPTLLFSLLLLLQHWEHRRSIYANKRRHGSQFNPPSAAVIVPVKGVDSGLADSLRSLLNQDYPDYEVHFVGESDHDPAGAVVRQLIREPHRCRAAHWHVAGRATDCGQKVHNLQVACEHIPDTAEIVAFADSDAHPDSRWLHNFAYRLFKRNARESQLGAVTGYRLCVPEQPTLANWINYSINSAVGGLLVRRGLFNMIWGGAWAIRRPLLEEVRTAWRHTISDDVVATRTLSRAGWRIRFDSKVMVPSATNMSLAQLMEFLRRQFFMARHYSLGIWLGTLLVWTGMLGGFWWNVFYAATAALTGAANPRWSAALAASIYAVGVGRAVLRQQASLASAPQFAAQLRPAQRFELWAHPLISLVGWASLVSSAVGSSIVWRGIHYRLRRDGHLIELRHAANDQEAPEETGTSNRAA